MRSSRFALCAQDDSEATASTTSKLLHTLPTTRLLPERDRSNIRQD
jgi:hypothetical protein